MRGIHRATLLPNGKVLVAGGLANGFRPLATAELYDPTSETWQATGSLVTARVSHTSTLLPNGKVLIAAGFGSTGALASAELYDSASGCWAKTGGFTVTNDLFSLSAATAACHHGRRYSVVGGESGATSTFFPVQNSTIRRAALGRRPAASPPSTLRTPSDPAAMIRFLSCEGESGGGKEGAARFPLRRGEGFHTITVGVVRSQNVGGLAGQRRAVPRRRCWPMARCSLRAVTPLVVSFTSAVLYDPASGTWAPTGSLVTARADHTATLLPNGKVLVVGGLDIFTLASAELYDPASGMDASSPADARYFHTATLLPKGKCSCGGIGSNRQYSGQRRTL